MHQTEMAYAYNKGADESVRQAQEQKLIGEVIKRWSTSGDDMVCSLCSSLEGVEIGMDEEFSFKGIGIQSYNRPHTTSASEMCVRY